MKQNTVLSRLAAYWKQGGDLSGEWLPREGAKDSKVREGGKEFSRRGKIRSKRGRFVRRTLCSHYLTSGCTVVILIWDVSSPPSWGTNSKFSNADIQDSWMGDGIVLKHGLDVHDPIQMVIRERPFMILCPPLPCLPCTLAEVQDPRNTDCKCTTHLALHRASRHFSWDAVKPFCSAPLIFHFKIAFAPLWIHPLIHREILIAAAQINVPFQTSSPLMDSSVIIGNCPVWIKDQAETSQLCDHLCCLGLFTSHHSLAFFSVTCDTSLMLSVSFWNHSGMHRWEGGQKR